MDMTDHQTRTDMFALIRDISQQREETERLRIQIEPERLRIDREPDRLRYDALNLREQRLLLLAQRPPAQKRKLDHLEDTKTNVTPRCLDLGRKPRLPPQSRDLLRTLVIRDNDVPHDDILPADAPPLTIEEYAWLAETLEEKFVGPHRQTWAVLWVPRPRRRDVFPTYLCRVIIA